MKKFNLLIILFTFMLMKSVGQQCLTTSNAAGPDKSICAGSSASLGARPISGATYSWYPTTWLDNPTSSEPIATPTTTTTYTVTIRSQNKLTNGDFESSGGFSTDYATFPNGDGSCGTGTFGGVGITTNPYLIQNFWCSRTDHSGNGTKMLVVDGSHLPNKRVWYSTVSVTLNTTYYFSGWVATVGGSPSLRIRINGVNLIQNVVTANTFCSDWVNFNVSWISGSSASAKIEIINDQLSCPANDFCLDDFVFSTCPIVVDDVKVSVASSLPSIGPITTVNFYNQYETSQNYVLTSNIATGGSQWYKNGSLISGATSQNLTVNLQGLGNGSDQYRVSNGCGLSNTATINYFGCNSPSCYPVSIPTNVCASLFPITISAPTLGSGTGYSWDTYYHPSCFTFSPAYGVNNTTQLGITSGGTCSRVTNDGIFSRATKGQITTIMFYVVNADRYCRTANSGNNYMILNGEIIPVYTKVTIAPNPASNKITINAPEPIEQIDIYSISGALVEKNNPKKKWLKLMLPVYNLAFIPVK